MATITFNIPDDIAPRVIDAFCYNYSYGVNAEEGETRAQFAKRMMIRNIKEFVKSVEQQKFAEDIREDTTLDTIA